MARRSTATRPVPAQAQQLPVVEHRLANGLRALVLTRRHVPVVVSDLHYPVGSFDEPSGKSGLAHFVEHMLFKGTKRFPKGQIDRMAFVAAGQSNAETGEDSTHYWFAFPSDRWELALAIEADRMRNAAFDPAEVEAERQVIIEERARDQESPLARLDAAHLAQSYIRHPYRNPILGWPDDLARVEVGDLKAFYARHYRPESAVLVVVGDVDPDRAFRAIEARFGGLKAGKPIGPVDTVDEPRQVGRRSFSMLEAESAARGILGWHSVPMGHPDGPALDVLSDVLSCGRRSRLWDALVERHKIASWVDSGQESSRRAGQFLIQVEAMPGLDAGRVERLIGDEVARIARDGVTPRELARSRHRLEAAWRWEQEDLTGLASGLGHYALGGDWRDWQAGHQRAVEVSSDDVRRVAQAYLVDSNLTAGWSLPGPARPKAVVGADEPPLRPAPVSTPPAHTDPIGLRCTFRPSRLVDYAPTRTTLGNGLRVLADPRAASGVVAIEFFADAGVLREARPGLASLTGRLLEEGTTLRSSDEMAEAIEDVGGAVDVGSTGVSLRVRAEDLPLAIEWLAELALRPRFDDESVAWIKRKMAAECLSDRDDPSFRADGLFRRMIYGKHPYGRDARGSSRTIRTLTRSEVVAHHDRYFRPNNAFLVASGEVEPEALARLVRRHFGRWPAGEPSIKPTRPSPKLRAGRPTVRRVSQPGEQVHVVLGHLGVTRLDPDFDALVVADHLLGAGPGFTDRLSRVIRDEMGLAYSVGGGMTDSADVEPGMFRVGIGTAPEHADRAVEAALGQIRAIHEGDFTDDEVERACQYLAGSWVFDYSTIEQRAERLLELEWWGLSIDEPAHWPDRISRVSTEQVRIAARRHLKPDQLCRVEYGPIVDPDRAT